MGQQGLPELWTLVKDRTQLLGWQLQDDLEALGLGALAALDEALPNLGVLPHLDGQGGSRQKGAHKWPPQKIEGPCQDDALLGLRSLPSSRFLWATQS